MTEITEIYREIPNPAEAHPFHAAHLSHTLGALAHLDRVMHRSPADAARNEGIGCDEDDETQHHERELSDRCGPDGTRLDEDTVWNMADEAGDRDRNEQ